ncbi:MAG: DUF3445 domain-containing protein [Verrucomicrobiae bacterium]|nr:DUF3445 domain-containing protein [Verrucomicrobiae bacterium]
MAPDPLNPVAAQTPSPPSHGRICGGRAPALLPLEQVFPDTDYGHRLKLQRAEPGDFFGSWEADPVSLAERARWMQSFPERHAIRLPEADPLIRECDALMRSWGVLRPGDTPDAGSSQPSSVWDLTAPLEPDLIWLTRGTAGHRMVAGLVCFPSSWAPEERIGLPIEAIHQVVPGLNPALGDAIERFLQRLPEGIAWLRANWGIAASPERNQHPLRRLPRLTPPLDPAGVWVRIEHQALVALPESDGILFGIRIEQSPIDDFRRNPALASGLARALQTMPEAMARYKGLADVRDELIRVLTGSDQAPVGTRL